MSAAILIVLVVAVVLTCAGLALLVVSSADQKGRLALGVLLLIGAVFAVVAVLVLAIVNVVVA